MPLYRIAYVTGSQAHSVVRQLADCPEPGARITLDAHTVLVVRDVVAQPEGGTIAAEVVAEVNGAEGTTAPGATEGATGSVSRSSR